MKIEEEIARCDREIAEMEQQPPLQPAYLTTLGIQDWEGEKRILQRIAATSGGSQ
jgi:hypothetical protein